MVDTYVILAREDKATLEIMRCKNQAIRLAKNQDTNTNERTVWRINTVIITKAVRVT